MGKSSGWVTAALAAGLAVLAGRITHAQEVTLRSPGGGVTVSGKLQDYDGEFYRIESPYGILTLNALGVTCQGLACPDPGQFAADITVSGTRNAVAGLLPALVEAFGFQTGHSTTRRDIGSWGWTYFVADSARIPVARIEATGVESAQAFADMAEDHVDFAITSRMPRKSEAAAIKTEGLGNIADPSQSQVLALDALVFLVSPENPVTALSLEQIRKIFTGEISNWRDLGGFDAPIALYGRRPGSDIADAFRAALRPEEEELSLAPVKVLKTDALLSDTVARDPFGIGYAAFSTRRNARALAIRGPCGMRQRPTAFTLRTGDYPLTGRVWLFTPKRRLPAIARRFLGFLKETSAQRTIAESGFVGLGLDAMPFSAQQERVGNAIIAADEDVSLAAIKGFVRVFGEASRLSLSFRFQDGSIKMDTVSTRSLKALAESIEAGAFDGRELIFAGFSDSQGGAAGNRRIARQRAEQVAGKVKTLAARANLSAVKIWSIGMGEVSPVACNDTVEGRQQNRRVEVWVK